MPDNQPSKRKPTIGLTGAIASGKSTVARRFAELGAAIIDSDQLAHQQLNEPDVVAQMRSWWQEALVVTDGQVDRRSVASIVFESPSELRRLEDLLYPRIERCRRSLTTDYLADPTIVAIVLDSPKLIDAGLHKCCDVVVLVECDRGIRLGRVAASRGWSEKELSRREMLLLPLDKQRQFADYTLVNQFGVSELNTEVDRVFSKIMAPYSIV